MIVPSNARRVVAMSVPTLQEGKLWISTDGGKTILNMEAFGFRPWGQGGPLIRMAAGSTRITTDGHG